MRKLALVMASVAGLGFAAPAVAMENSAAQGRIQLAQLSVSVGTPRATVRERVIVRGDRDRRHNRNWRSHRAQSDSVVIVKRKPMRKTVIIQR
jgi:hypothetical protein